jgi:hypothetical protein
MPPRTKKKAKKPSKKQIQVYTNTELTALLEKARKEREVELRRDAGPSAKQTLSGLICGVLFKHLAAKKTYDSHQDGGWRGYWDTVQAAVAPPTKKKEKRS